MVSILVLFILLFRAFLLFVVSPLTFLILVLTRARQSLRNKRKANNEGYEISWEAIGNLLKAPNHRDYVSLYWQYHVLNFAVVLFLIMGAFKEGSQLGYLMTIIGGYFMYLGFKEKSAENWKRKTSLAKDQFEGYIKVKTLSS